MKVLVFVLLLAGLATTPFFYSAHPSLNWQWGWIGVYLVYLVFLYRKFDLLFSQWSYWRGIVSFVLACAWVYSSHTHAISGMGPVLWIITILAITMWTLTIYSIMAWLEIPFGPKMPKPKWWYGFLYGAVPAFVWFLYFCSYFPGKMTYDSFWQWDMAHHIMPYNAWHPVLHTWLIEATTWLYDSPASYSIVQIILVSAIVGYALYHLQSFGVPKLLVVLIDLFYALDPINGFYTITMWKDIPFAAFILLFTVLIAKVILSKGEWLKHPLNMAALILVAFLTMNLRDNGVEVVIASLLLFIVFVKRSRMRMTFVLLPVLLLYFIFHFPLMNAFHVIRNPLNQALAVPSQQIAAVYKTNGHFTPKLKGYFNQILPAEKWAEDYRPHTVNPIKHDPMYNADVINQSFSTYLGNWAKLLTLNPVTFVKAYLKQVALIWQFHTPGKMKPYFTSSRDLQDYSLGIKLNAPIEDWGDPQPMLIKEAYRHYVTQTQIASPKLPVMTFAQYQKAAKETVTPLKTKSLLPSFKIGLNQIYKVIQHKGLKNYFFKGAIPIILLLISLTAAIRRRGITAVRFFLPVCFVIITIAMAMPAPDYRYLYSFIFTLPFLFWVGKWEVD